MAKRRFSTEQEIKICQDYSCNESMNSIASRLETYPSTIKNILKRNNVSIRSISQSNRKYKLNEKFFDNVSSEESAYILGLLFADGYHNEKQNMIRLCLREQDAELLEKIRAIIGSSKPLYTRTFAKENWSDQKELAITSLHMSQSLINLGLRQNKSSNATMPDNLLASHSFCSHLIRGVYDGDGCLSWRKPKINNIPQSIFRIIASESMAEQIQASIYKYCDIETRIAPRKESSKVVEVQQTGNNKVKSILEWLYCDATLYMKRKRDKFEELRQLTTEDIKRRNILATRETSGFHWRK